MPETSVKSILKLALQQHQAGRLDDAEQAYRRALAIEPKNAQALHFLGMIQHTRGDHASAAELMEESVHLRPRDPIYLNNLGGVYRSLKRYQDARGVFERAITEQPNLAQAHANLGLTLRDLGQLPAAEESLRRAVQWEPRLADAHLQLGTVLKEQNKLDQAIASFQKALDLQPGNTKALEELRFIHRKRKEYDREIAYLSKLALLEPDKADHHAGLGVALGKVGQPEASLAAYQRSLELDPDCFNTYMNLAAHYDRCGLREQTLKMYEQALRVRPDNATAKYSISAMTGKTEPTAPTEYVVSLFDQYADTFEKHLVDRLEYRVPELLCKAVRELGSERKLDVIDLGCGTGLCGQFIAPVVGALVGVDVSTGMLEKAKERNLYTELLCADIVPVLKERPEQFDVALSADVFIYVGSLDDVFPAVASSLRPGGIFAFSIEGFDGDGFVLRPSRRYAHSLEYIRRLASQSGLIERSVMPTMIRREHDSQIDGYLVLLEKPAT